ncbi:MAG: type II secretion system F family protein [Halioglobus sp.]
MPDFTYRAVAGDGRTVNGSIAADRIEMASRQLRQQGLTLLSLEPATAGKVAAAVTGSSEKLAGADDILALTRELCVLLRAGLPIDRALKVMIDMASGDKMRALLDDLLASVKGGKGLSQALDGHRALFGNFYINMVRAGEASGHLPEVLARLLAYLENTKAVRSSVISALIYPAILLVVAVLSIIAMLGFVVPQFEALFADMGDALPLLTRWVIATGDVIKDYGWLLLLITAIAVYFARNWARSEQGRASLDARALKLPLLGTVIFKYEVAKFARTVGTLMGNGVSLLQSSSIATDTVDNTQVKDALRVLEPAVKRGQRMSVALEETGVFSPMVIQMVRVGEESGSLDQMMTELAQVYDEEVEAGVKRSLTLLEPFLILTMGGTIAVVIIAILMGIMSVNDLAI